MLEENLRFSIAEYQKKTGQKLELTPRRMKLETLVKILIWKRERKKWKWEKNEKI